VSERSRAKQSRVVEQRAVRGNDDIGELASGGGRGQGSSLESEGGAAMAGARVSRGSGVRACGARGSRCLGVPLCTLSLMLRCLPAAASLFPGPAFPFALSAPAPGTCLLLTTTTAWCLACLTVHFNFKATHTTKCAKKKLDLWMRTRQMSLDEKEHCV
jgi:hypothetical protein